MLAAQTGSEEMLGLLREDPDMVVWWGTVLECRVAVNRLYRESVLTPVEYEQAGARLAFLTRNWLEIAPTEDLRNTAIGLSFDVALKAADTLQLSAAVVWRGEETPGAEFVCLDRRLRSAATFHGFTAIPVAA